MNHLYPIMRPADSIRMVRYRNLPLVNLIKRIVDKGDRLALMEFHNNRTLFRFK